jgi:hypothetical protein
MNFDPVAIGKALSDAGGWAAFLAVVILIGIGSLKRFRFWVPGWLYEDERAQRAISEIQAERTIEALEEQAKAFTAMSRELQVMSRTDESLRGELADLRRRFDRLRSD